MKTHVIILGRNMLQYDNCAVTFCSLYALQFLAHDTDKSPELSSRDFDVTSDVMLPIPVPKVSSENIQYIMELNSLWHVQLNSYWTGKMQ